MKTAKTGNYADGVSIISPGVEIKGDIGTKGSIRIDGKVEGNITADGNITIGDTGEILGNLNGKAITVGGIVKGIVHSHDKLTLEAKAVVEGDLFAKVLVIEEGARFHGKSSMNSES